MSSSLSKRITIVEKLKHEKQTAKEMLDDALINNDEYRKIEMQIEQLKEDLKAKKAELLAVEKNEKIVSKMKEIGQDLKEEREILTEELIEHYRTTQKKEVLSEDGKKLMMKLSARLIPLEDN